MATNIQNAIDDKIRKLQQLRDLLSDPEIAKIARNILSHPNATASAIDAGASDTLSGQAIPRRFTKKKRGTLVKKVAAIISESAVPLTARQVADVLEVDGFEFKANDKYVSVSKALRGLALNKKIGDMRGDHAKAAIRYTRLPSLVPVQETRH
jgi:hypothetical protein